MKQKKYYLENNQGMPVFNDTINIKPQNSSLGFLSKTALISVTEEALNNSHDRKLRGWQGERDRGGTQCGLNWISRRGRLTRS